MTHLFAHARTGFRSVLSTYTVWTVAPYFLLVIVHAACGWPMQQPGIFADELAYLGHARYLSGSGLFPNMGTTNIYHFGYSLFLLPAFWMFGEPIATYRAVMITNAFLISALYFGVYSVLRTGFDTPRHVASVVAFVTCLYPAFVLQSTFAWAENALIPAYAASVAAFCVLLRRPSYRVALALGLLVAFLYTIHPRALAVLPMTALALVGLSVRRKISWPHALVAVASIGLVFLATETAGDHLRSVGWLPRKSPLAVTPFVSRLLTVPSGVLLQTAGQLLYLAQATYGLFLVGPAYAGVLVWRQGVRGIVSRYEINVILSAAFVLATSAAMMAPSVLTTAYGGSRADHLVYGRYNEAFLSIYVAFGLALLSSGGFSAARRAVVVSIVCVIALLTAVVLVGRGEMLTSRLFVGANIFGIYPAARMLGRIHVDAISLASIGIFLGVSWLFARKPQAGLAGVAACFLLVSGYGYRAYCMPERTALETPDVLPSTLRELGDPPAVSVDWGFRERLVRKYYLYQYLLPHTRFNTFNSKAERLPGARVVISDRFWEDGEALRARMVVVDGRSNLALWLLPGADRYHSASRTFVNVRLGWRRFPGVWESGFYRQERGGEAAFRWTNGNARLVVPIDGGSLPQALAVTLAYPPRTSLRLVANGTELFAGALPAGGEQMFSLRHVPMTDWVTIQLLSDTFVPSQIRPSSRDNRRLGVAIRGVRLLRE